MKWVVMVLLIGSAFVWGFVAGSYNRQAAATNVVVPIIKAWRV